MAIAKTTATVQGPRFPAWLPLAVSPVAITWLAADWPAWILTTVLLRFGYHGLTVVFLYHAAVYAMAAILPIALLHE